MKVICQFLEKAGQLISASDIMGCHSVKIRPAHIFIEQATRGTPLPAALDVFIENAADEQGVVAYMSPDQKCLVWRSCFEREQKVREIPRFYIFDRRMQLPNLREFLQQRSDIICQRAVVYPRAFQDEPSQNVKVKLRRNGQVARSFEYGSNQLVMVQDLVPGFEIG